jgi:tetratricopeptide (TPR) repeat protein
MRGRTGAGWSVVRVGSCAVAIAVLGGVPAVRAQEEPERGDSGSTRVTPRESIELYQRAREAYRHGRYAEAARDLENALVLDPGSPTLLYNLARVYELAGELERAIAVYRRYLRVIPENDTAERERTEAAIVRIQGAQSYRRPDEEIYSQPLYVSQRGVADEAFWATLAAGGVITVSAAVIAILAAQMDAEMGAFTIGRDGDASEWQARLDSVRALATAADVVGATGGATLVAAFLLYILREQSVELYPEARRAPSASLAPGPGEFGLGARLRW